MLFNSHIFLFLFLPLTLAGYYSLGLRIGKWSAFNFLTVASLVFYGYWNPRYTALIIASIVFNFWLGDLQHRSGKNRVVLWAGVAVNLSVLGFYKYGHFAAVTLNELTGLRLTVQTVALPLAISFFTFTQIAYIVDVYRGLNRRYTFREYCFFVLFFPHLIAGPIVRHYEIIPQIGGDIFPFKSQCISAGFTVFILGLAKKVLLADTVASTATRVFDTVHQGDSPHLILAWAGALAYTVQLYFDFSGYSDMAIGLAYMFGIKLPLNFNSPYNAVSIIDFWRRWHISLSRFLRDYLYIPLGGSRTRLVRRCANLWLTMLLGGLWHGAGWTFVIWGGMHGFYLMVNHAWRAVTKSAPWAQTRIMRAGYRVVTFASVVVGWVLFRSETLADAGRLLQGMVAWNGVVLPRALQVAIPTAIQPVIFFNDLGFSAWEACIIAVLLAIAVLAPNTQELLWEADPALERAPAPARWSWSASAAWACYVGVLSAVVICSLGRVSEFLYFQF